MIRPGQRQDILAQPLQQRGHVGGQGDRSGFFPVGVCGQTALAENESLPPESKMPLSKPVFRRRLRSVIQDLMYFAARLTKHSNRWGLSLWWSNPWRPVWERVYACLRKPPDPASS